MDNKIAVTSLASGMSWLSVTLASTDPKVMVTTKPKAFILDNVFLSGFRDKRTMVMLANDPTYTEDAVPVVKLNNFHCFFIQNELLNITSMPSQAMVVSLRIMAWKARG